jgi:hypothetical protein
MSEDVDQQDVKKTSVADILASVSELNKKQITEIYVPSLKRELSFRPLTVKQQKSLLSSGVDVEVENLTFSNTINDIILENCLSNKDKIKLTDRAMIVYQLRCNCVNETLKFYDDDVEYTINLLQHVDDAKGIEVSPPTTFSVESDDLKITGEVPDLKRDTMYNRQFTKTIKLNKNPQGIRITDIVGDIYIHEMVKYVTSITAGEQTLVIDSNIPADQAIQIFESLPMTISSKIANKIKECRELEILTMSSDTLPEDVQLPFDASIFTSE